MNIVTNGSKPVDLMMSIQFVCPHLDFSVCVSECSQLHLTLIDVIYPVTAIR